MSRDAVFVDSSFLVAVADPGSAEHPAARAAYADLIRRSRTAEVVLVSHALAVDAASDWLGADGRDRSSAFDDLIAPIEIEPARRDALRLAQRTLAAHPGLDLAQALTLAMMARRKIATIATVDALYAGYDVKVIPGRDASNTASESDDGRPATESGS